jgi:hypothetical protein
MWAARALDYMDQDHPARERLRQTAKRLGATEGFQLTDQARAREDAVRQQRRRAAWKGPKRKRVSD